MLYKKEQAQPFVKEGGTEGRLYAFDDTGRQTVATVTIDGRYPESGYSINDISTETVYLLEGNVTLTANDQEFHLEPGDLFAIRPQVKYAILGRARAMVFITPAWKQNNNRVIDQ